MNSDAVVVVVVVVVVQFQSVHGVLIYNRAVHIGRSGLSTWKYQFSYDH